MCEIWQLFGSMLVTTLKSETKMHKCQAEGQVWALFHFLLLVPLAQHTNGKQKGLCCVNNLCEGVLLFLSTHGAATVLNDVIDFLYHYIHHMVTFSLKLPVSSVLNKLQVDCQWLKISSYIIWRVQLSISTLPEICFLHATFTYIQLSLGSFFGI